MSTRTFYNHGNMEYEFVDEELSSIETFGDITIVTYDTKYNEINQIQFEETTNIYIEVFDYDAEVSQEPDEDINGYVTFYDLKSVEGSIAEINLSGSGDVDIIAYCKARKLVFAILPELRDEYPKEFIEKYEDKPVTKDTIYAFFKLIENNLIDDEVEDLVFPVLAKTTTFNSFKDTGYGDLTGQDFDGHLDLSNMNLKSLEGCPITVSSLFDITGCKLTSYEFGPKEVEKIICDKVIDDLQFFPNVLKPVTSNVAAGNTDIAKIELEYRLKNPMYGLNKNQVGLDMFEKTKDGSLLDQDIKDTFLF